MKTKVAPVTGKNRKIKKKSTAFKLKKIFKLGKYFILFVSLAKMTS